ncbi:uncharacterized protein At3g28850 [Cajanus cajan]|uniref:uncharacterized protein At3g28850 n=1 Tax=Cajanus cajan TaxID=3821 RepID=UPI00098DCBE2|nr:uncharacterized protein At3g28850 [Cajanus cajan]
MGCGSSKDVAVPYRPAATSLAVFDINAIEEPWLKQVVPHEKEEKQTLGEPILDKLKMLDETQAPKPWEEVRKTLEDLKPLITKEPQKSESFGFHTLEELDGKLKPNPEAKKATPTVLVDPLPRPRPRGKKLQDNIFIVRDRLERQKEEKESKWRDRDPLSAFPENSPPGGADTVVLYTTSLGGVRKTFEECNRARDVLEAHRVVFDERDVSLHGGFLREVKELVGEAVAVALPRVFVKGRYVGGLEELVELNETGRLRRILNATRVERGVGRQACGGCGGARFVPCLECGGSCKVAVDGVRAHKERCPNCNENGLVHCPACISLPL